MNFSKNSLIIVLALCFIGPILAQNEIDVLRFSRNTTLGTTRSMSLGGAMSAVGADYSAASLNPAGFGLYRRGDIVLTSSFRTYSTGTEFLGLEQKNLSSSFGIQNFGYVYNRAIFDKPIGDEPAKQKTKGLKSFTIGFGFNEVANYNQDVSGDGYNEFSSLTDFFAEQAQGKAQASLTGTNSFAGLAWASGLIFIDTSGVDGQWLPAVKGGNVQQSYRLIENGRKNDWNLSFAGNVSDKIYFGASLGVQNINYVYDLRYVEEDINEIHQNDIADSSSFSRLDFEDYFRTRGYGINAKVGVILRPVDFLRIGVSAQTPTWFNLRDNFFSTLTANFDGDPITYGLEDENNPESISKYTLITPWKVTVGTMIIIKKMGFVSIDADVMDYSSAQLVYRDEDGPIADPFASSNKAINDQFRFTYNLRVGAEFKYKIMRFRAGAANYGAALNKEARQYYEFGTTELQQITGDRWVYSGGIGIKQKNYYIDLAYVRDQVSERSLLYTLSDPTDFSPDVISSRISNSFYMTIGFTF